MIEVDVATAGARDRRRTWMLGGGLLVVCALLTLGLNNPGLPMSPLLVRLPDLLFSAAAVIFAVGLGRAGSVTARKPAGTWALVGLALWLLLASPLLLLLQPEIPDDVTPAQLNDLVMTSAMLGITSEVVALILALVGVMRIGREGVVPRPWRWAPLWTLLVITAVRMLRSGFLFGQQGLDQESLVTLDSLGVLLAASAIGFLGVLAMVLAVKPPPAETAVYSSAR